MTYLKGKQLKIVKNSTIYLCLLKFENLSEKVTCSNCETFLASFLRTLNLFVNGNILISQYRRITVEVYLLFLFTRTYFNSIKRKNSLSWTLILPTFADTYGKRQVYRNAITAHWLSFMTLIFVHFITHNVSNYFKSAARN